MTPKSNIEKAKDPEPTVIVDRRANKLRLDKTINLGNLLTIISILYAAYTGVNKIIDGFKDTQLKTEIMWNFLVADHPDLEKLYRVR